jgi:hypothetical protein
MITLEQAKLAIKNIRELEPRNFPKSRICARSSDRNQRAVIDYDGSDIYLRSKGRSLMISEGELYDMITLCMSAHYQDFMEELQ